MGWFGLPHQLVLLVAECQGLYATRSACNGSVACRYLVAKYVGKERTLSGAYRNALPFQCNIRLVRLRGGPGLGPSTYAVTSATYFYETKSASFGGLYRVIYRAKNDAGAIQTYDMLVSLNKDLSVMPSARREILPCSKP